MKKDNAFVRIVNESESFDNDRIEFYTNCNYYLKDDKAYIFYDEKEEMGMADCNVSIKAETGIVTVTRKGAFSSKMVYIPENVTEFIYNMPYGSVAIELYTVRINQEFNEDGGRLILIYETTINGDTQAHAMKITVSRDKNVLAR